MRSWLLGAALCALLSAPARAELQVFQANFSLLGLVSPAPVQTVTGVATVNGSGSGSHVNTLALPGGLFSLHLNVPVSGGALPLTSLHVDVTLDGGTVMRPGGGGTLRGPIAAPGNVRLCVLATCALYFDVPLTENATHGVGLGGAPIVRPLASAGTIMIGGADWQTGMVTAPTTAGAVSLVGFAHGPLSNTSSTAAPLGVLQLVTPVAVTANVFGSPSALPLFGVLEVKLLPEPGSLSLCAAGALALVLLGRRRARR